MTETAEFRLELQDDADKSPCFPRPRKVVLANGIVLRTRWYRPPAIERSLLCVKPDVKLPNGIVLRAAWYRPTTFGQGWCAHDVARMDQEYLAWKAARRLAGAHGRPKTPAVQGLDDGPEREHGVRRRGPGM